ncbi:MAG: acyl-CoA thioesterase II [Saprospiraceae bacterium]|nr:acyl-CoA thioesterase II [Saprospiraceae bacterium]
MVNVSDLISALALEQIEDNIFRGTSHDIGASHVFGGQVLSQALEAAILTTSPDRIAHSMHAYFILPGDLEHPIIYMVDQVRDGGSFTTRRVKAIQHGKDIFIMAVSFQLKQDGLHHQAAMPKMVPPDDLQSDEELLSQFADRLPESFKRFLRPRPIEFRPVDPFNFILPEKQEPLRHIWFRAKGTVEGDQTLHQRLLAYASDYNLLTTAIQPHQDEIQIYQVQLASLDHAMWFHRPVNMNDWLLYEVDSPSASNARGFTRGSIFDQNGTLVASVAQEGLIRPKKKKK